MKVCSKCKIEKNNNCFSKRSDRKIGLQSACKKCHKIRYENNKEKILKQNKEWAFRNKQKFSAYGKKFYYTKRGKYNKYKKSARSRNINFDLTFDEFIYFWENPCFYCGSPINNIGLDRVNNNIGYTINNIVPCCIMCNKIKLDLSCVNFINYIEQVKNFITYNIIRINNRIILNKSLKQQYNSYKQRTKRRKIEFLLTVGDFEDFKNIPCFYCGTITNNIIGIDRVDNSKGYINNNVVSCCKFCNSGKGTMDVNNWIQHLKFLSKFDVNKLKKYL
jgi:hypothetical protein